MMITRAFKDDKDGYYQVQLEDGEELPEWTIGMTECDVLPLAQDQDPVPLSPVEKLKAFIAANPDVASLLQ